MRTALLLLLLLPAIAGAAEVQSFTPQGSVRDVRQATARFSEPMVNFGDPRAADPFSVDCGASAQAQGHGRWADGRVWVYDFEQDLPAGLRCQFTLLPSVKALSGAAPNGKRSFGFDTGGPAVRDSMPDEGAEQIDEEQIFLLALDAPATTTSIEAAGYCAVANLAERLPLKVIEGEAREALLAQRRLLGYSYYRILWKDGGQSVAQVKTEALARAEANIAVVRCARPLPNAAQVDLVWGSGIAAVGGAATAQDQVLRFRTRPAFNARFECERVNASAPCVPVLPMRVIFSAPVPREQAAKLRLGGPGGDRKPQLDEPDAPFVQSLQFMPPFPESARFQLSLPADLKDDASRRLENASSFPLEVATDEAPPLAKFNGEFGIIELNEGGVLPVTLRALEDTVPAAAIGGAAKRIDDEAQVLQWMQLVKTRMQADWSGETYQHPGLHSVFEAGDGAAAFSLNKPEGGKAFEVVGIPLAEPGFHVVELASPRLGAALLGKNQPRYVATTALVTNLAVHFKWGRQGSAVFVTTLDQGRPVAGAALKVVDGCDATPIWSGTTDAAGIARIDSGLPKPESWSSCNGEGSHPLMVSARKDGDFSFALSSWNEGIQPWDFQLPTATWESPTLAHTVLDRALFRAGETVSMKHILREHAAQGLIVPGSKPKQLVIEHSGSGQTVQLPLHFDASGIAESQWQIPKEARLGEYQLRLDGDGQTATVSGQFRVEQYRVPLMRALIQGASEPLVAPKEVPLDLFVGYFSGGGASGLPVKLRTQLQPRSPSFKHYDTYRFDAEKIELGVIENGGSGYFPDAAEGDAAAPRSTQTLPLTLDANGNASTTVPTSSAAASAPQTLIAELEYPDANGELTSVRSQTSLWPAGLAVGLSTEGWVSSKDRLRFSAVVLDLKGQPLPGRSVNVALYQRQEHAYRKRLVGGFYAYSHSEETQAVDASCSGKTDAQGLLFCDIVPGASGEILLEASARDDQGRVARAVASRWMAGDEDGWFQQGDSDRMDLVPEKREVEPGEKLRLQVRMPFRHATGLVTVEREGVLDAFVIELSGRDPVIELPIIERYAPNVFVSVLALRPRVGDFRSRFHDFLRGLGLDRLFKLQLDSGRPTALVDLSKPAYRLGMAALDVGWTAHRLKVEVQPDREVYKVRDHARVQVQVTAAPGTTLPPQAEIAFSAVDEGLLDLQSNPSTELLLAMMQRRGIDVFTATAQMQVVGKRHYGRKAMAPGGGGGRGAARELLDSLLLWKGRVPLDAQGRASIDLPLNDALSSFRLTAIASAGTDRFGTGSASIRTTQDVQLLSGLAPLLREEDRYEALFTVRNTSDHVQQVALSAEVTADGAETAVMQTQQSLSVPANSAAPVRFELPVPLGVAQLHWSLQAHSDSGELLDALKVAQEVIPATPVRTWQATLLQLDPAAEMPVSQPPDALPSRGGIRVGLQSSLTGSLDGVREWMRAYPYVCFEQNASKAVALRDRAGWDAQMARLPGYLDGDGLVRYFPSGWIPGSDTLTAYLLALADEAGWPIPESERQQMLNGLTRFVQGRIERGSPLKLSDQTERKLAAIEALSRHKVADVAALSSLAFDPTLLHTSALIDWISILQKLDKVPDSAAKLEQAQQILRSRLNFQGTTMGFSTERDDALWWLMSSADLNANRALLVLMSQPGWREDLPRLMRGALGRQQRGHWDLTTANAWGVLAVEKFAQAFERDTVAGSTAVNLADEHQRHDWAGAGASGATLDLPWPASPQTLQLQHAGSGKPWAFVSSRAAIPLREPFSSGYRIERSVVPVQQQVAGRWTRGDVARITVTVDAQSDMSWVVVDDPVPGGGTVLGGGLGRDSAMLAQGERREGDAWPAFEERRADAYRAYYAFVPKGRFTTEYTVRYNSAGHFGLPTTRVEAMYAPEMLGELPNAALEIAAP